MYYSIFYLSGFPRPHKPITANLHVTKSGLKLFGYELPWSQVVSSEVTYEVKDSSVSAGKAVAGAVLAGGVGAVVGGMMGGNKVVSYLKVTYVTQQGQQQVLMSGNKCDQANKAIQKRLKDKMMVATKQTSQAQSGLHLRKFVYWYFALYRYSYRLIKKLLNIRKTRSNYARK